VQRGAAIALVALAAAAPLQAQSRFHAGLGVGAGFVFAVADTRASYGAGPAGEAELAFGRTGSPWSARFEARYLRLHGADSPDLGFPSLNVLAFGLSAVRRLGAAGRYVSPYALAGAGAHNLQDALPFAAYHTRLGVHLGFGAEIGPGRLRAFVEGRITHITSQPPIDLAGLSAGMRWGL